jgi:spore coat polysaccharide biosynthesis protein SpsF (cytidylyltransferase family)
MKAVIICTRTDSERLPNKPFRLINGVPLINHLISRLQKTGLKIIIAYPREQKVYESLAGLENVELFPSMYAEDPLRRMDRAAKQFGVKTIVRVSHDKIFVDTNMLNNAMQVYEDKGLDYLYSTSLIPGSGFEIIDSDALERAAKKYKNIEYIGFAVKSVTPKEKIHDFKVTHVQKGLRFLVDYPSDLTFLEVIFSQLGNDCTLQQAVKYVFDNPEIKQINKMPALTIYTCAYNAEKWLERCMDSVARQKHFAQYEYILIDDHSTDKTCEIMAKFALKYPNVSWIRNEKNIGLASSSNVALKKARGRYIIRLDADDYFVSCTALEQMLKAIDESGKDAIYPNNYFGSLNTIQNGKLNHHVGGTIFKRDAINHIKFTEGLKNWDSLDVFLRARTQLDIGYLEKAMFFYSQHGESMSKVNLKERAEQKEKLLTKWANQDFYEEDDDLDFKDLGVDIEPNH